MPQVKVASSSEDLGGLTKCPSAPDIAHHKLDVSSTGARHPTSRPSSRGLSKGAGQLLGRAATLKSRTPSPRGGVSPTAAAAAASYGKADG